MVKLLLAQGCDVNAIGSSEQSALHAACAAPNASPDIVRTLLEHGAKINALDKLGRSPLIKACGRSSIDNIRLLVSHGADVDLRDEFDRHPLHTVCERSQDPENSNASSNIINFLLSHCEEGILSSECKAIPRQVDTYPETSPLAIAMWVEDVGTMEALNRHGAYLPSSETMKAALWKPASPPRGRIFVQLLSMGAEIKGQ